MKEFTKKSLDKLAQTMILIFIIPAAVSGLNFEDNLMVESDSNKWHPKEFIIIYPDMQLTIKLPYEEAQSGVYNLFFQSQESGIIHPLDTLKKMGANDTRCYTLFSPGIYNIILVYNNGNYLKYSDVIFEKDAVFEVDMENVDIQKSSDNEFQYWLTFRTFNSVAGTAARRNNIKNYETVSDSAIKIRGYLFVERGDGDGEASLDAQIVTYSKNSRLIAAGSLDGYFEFELDDINQTVAFRYMILYLPIELKFTKDCGLFLVMKESPDIEKYKNAIFRNSNTVQK